jgi:hypothetical protein
VADRDRDADTALARDVAGEEPPPLGAWWRLYALVVGELILTILLLWWLTRAFA